MEFCPKCSNLLYPKEDRERGKLLDHCRNCNRVQEATKMRVFQNDITKSKRTELFAKNSDITLDPTLPIAHDVKCSKCQGTKAVFITPTDETMELLFVCLTRRDGNPCGNTWSNREKKKPVAMT
eukprot:gb/GEZN01022882.1/.p1 GENE.gb/GEZN01022882.1/~~gb/GEZN01022882.1/.p1  ORF type:complete len:124 (-),score=16.01 gb/GEZN01022882.1/:165-536(-)